jgi:hypothetical protein
MTAWVPDGWVETVTGWARLAELRHAQRALRDLLGGRATAWLGEQAGIQPRTARRWMSPACPPSRADTVMSLAVDRIITVHGAPSAADPVLAGYVVDEATAVDPGTIELGYDGDSEGPRTPGEHEVYLGEVADHLKDNDLARAAEAFSQELLNAYGAGLGESLEIITYSGVTLYY